MKHNQYKLWILNEKVLTPGEEKDLVNHLSICEYCFQLNQGWQASRTFLEKAVMKTPAPGFTARWQNTRIKKCRLEKVKRYRLTMFGLLILAFIASMTYMVASNSFMHLLGNFFNSIAQVIFGITNGLATIGYWFRALPMYIPITAGLVFFGLLNAFLMVGVFTLWNLKSRNRFGYETAKN